MMYLKFTYCFLRFQSIFTSYRTLIPQKIHSYFVILRKYTGPVLIISSSTLRRQCTMFRTRCLLSETTCYYLVAEIKNDLTYYADFNCCSLNSNGFKLVIDSTISCSAGITECSFQLRGCPG